MWWLDVINPQIYMDGKAHTSKKLAQFKNSYTFQNVFVMKTLEAMRRYRVGGIDDTMNERVINEALLWNASFVVFKEGGKNWALPGFPTNAFTMNGEPTHATVYGRNGFTKTVKLYIPQGGGRLGRRDSLGVTVAEEGEAVLLRENDLMYPFINIVMFYCEKIADTYRTLDVTRANIKRPYVVTAEESIIDSVKEYFNKRDNNEEYIISSGVFPADKISITGLEMNPDNIRDCTGLIDYYESKLRELEAISSAPATIDKKAQITTDELHQNKGVEDVIRTIVENTLSYWLEFCNKCMGTNMYFENLTEPQEIEADGSYDKGDKENDTGNESDKDL